MRGKGANAAEERGLKISPMADIIREQSLTFSHLSKIQHVYQMKNNGYVHERIYVWHTCRNKIRLARKQISFINFQICLVRFKYLCLASGNIWPCWFRITFVG